MAMNEWRLTRLEWKQMKQYPAGRDIVRIPGCGKVPRVAYFFQPYR